jgi:hypothetical protein
LAVHAAQTQDLLRLRDSEAIGDQVGLHLQLALDAELHSETEGEG